MHSKMTSSAPKEKSKVEGIIQDTSLKGGVGVISPAEIKGKDETASSLSVSSSEHHPTSSGDLFEFVPPPMPLLVRQNPICGLPSRPGAYQVSSSFSPVERTPRTPPRSQDHDGAQTQNGDINPEAAEENDIARMEEGIQHSGLAEATPVAELPHDTPHAIPVCEETSEARNFDKASARKALGVVILVVFAVVLVGISLLVVFVLKSNDDEEVPLQSLAATNTPSAHQELLLLDTLPAHLLPAIEAAGEESPQQRALDWLLADLNLPTYSPLQVTQRYVLAVLYYATQGDRWVKNQNWLSYDHHECEWHVADTFTAFPIAETSDSPCNDEGVYERLWLSANGLNGTLPEEIYALTSLKSIDFVRNMELRGTISTQIGLLTSMDKLSFTVTGLTGTIPSEIGRLTNMQFLYLLTLEFFPFKLSGTIPNELYQLTKLSQLVLQGQDFSGTISSEIGLLTDLFDVGMHSSHYTGSIPTEIGNLSHLKQAYFFGNALTGTIPTELALPSSLLNLHLHSNLLTGSIPSELGTVTSMKELSLSDNRLVGTIPTQLAQIQELYILFLSQNEGLTGTIPSEFSRLTFLSAFDSTNTSLTGDLPAPLQTAQDDIDFARFEGECKRRIPCNSDNQVNAPHHGQ